MYIMSRSQLPRTWSIGAMSAIFLILAARTAIPAIAQCQEDKLTYSDAQMADLLGWSLDMDGDWLVAGMNRGFEPFSKIVVWQRVGDQWVEWDALSPNGDYLYDSQRIQAAVSGDVLVGNGWNDYEHESGFAVVYRRINGEWIEEQRIEPFLPEQSNPYLHSIDISGNWIMIGCRDCVSPSNQGVRVYRYNGAAWTYVQTLAPPELAELGRRISIDGNWAAMEEYYEDTESHALRLYEYDGQTWVLRQTLQSPPGEVHWNFGSTFDVSGDRLAVVVWRDDVQPLDCEARVYRLVDQSWIPEAVIEYPENPQYSNVGCTVRMNGDRLVMMTRIEGLPDDCYAVHSFRFEQNQWAYQGTSLVDCSVYGNWFGLTTAISGDNFATSAMLDDEAAHGAGAVFAFNLNDADCNNNGVCDRIDIADGTSWDIDGNGIPEECDCVGDLNGDRVVDLDDLAQLLGHYAATGDVSYYQGDLDFDGDVDLDDLAEMLSRYGDTCPWPA